MNFLINYFMTITATTVDKNDAKKTSKIKDRDSNSFREDFFHEVKFEPSSTDKLRKPLAKREGTS